MVKFNDAQEFPDRVMDATPPLDEILDRDSLHILEALEISSFENLFHAFDSIARNAPLFTGDTTFQKAATALDLSAKLFSLLDHDHDKALTYEELEYYINKSTAANQEALSWLLDHFKAFTKACFFEDAITRDDIEEARNVFHGLHVLHEKFGLKEGQPTEGRLLALNPEVLKDFLETYRNDLEIHEIHGLEELIDYLEKLRA